MLQIVYLALHHYFPDSHALLWSFNSVDFRWHKFLQVIMTKLPLFPCKFIVASVIKSWMSKARLLKRRTIISSATAFAPFHVTFSSGRGVNIAYLNDVYPWTSHDTSPMRWVKICLFLPSSTVENSYEGDQCQKHWTWYRNWLKLEVWESSSMWK